MDLRIEENDLVRGRYRCRKTIGQGAVGFTVLCVDEKSGKNVVVKLLDLERLKNWKQYDLFERETKILQNISHPNIPAYVDSFRLENEKCLGLVQTYIEGVNLHERVREGWHCTEGEAVSLTGTLLDILVYLQGLQPPVIHRDINPRNIVIDGMGTPYLVDFDAAHVSITGQMFGSDTVVGSLGYMPMDQIMGRATLSVDLYALGVTIVFLLTHKEPESLPLKNMKLDFAPLINASDGLVRFLDLLIEPDHEKRVANAARARELLDSMVMNPSEYGVRYVKADLVDDESRVRLSPTAGDAAEEEMWSEAPGEFVKVIEGFRTKMVRKTVLDGNVIDEDVAYFVQGKPASKEEFERHDIRDMIGKGMLRRAGQSKPPKKMKRATLLIFLSIIFGFIVFSILIPLLLLL
jgi:serine/threonine protein kinase